MYNGIGIRTPRGTGTSGYVQASLVSIKPPPAEAPIKKKVIPKISKQLEEYKRKRKTELILIKLRQKLERKKTPPDEIEEAVKAFRQKIENTAPKTEEINSIDLNNVIKKVPASEKAENEKTKKIISSENIGSNDNDEHFRNSMMDGGTDDEDDER
ncbi:hypothetical protein TRFO_03366 [Tritrichomonas foetus]|uniref:CWF21 domain-containing protein n=1 Tax=Tritrichomonas foetus TaxID=1144522 RepID=A0A1J4KV23_9EUKA|nr:hypothetical protein TRFO_03366 [Tritrichomonas foetus]|eukprot:OHT13596.1 hypothetical protein TRFO_03366 [Tritrichomonas foetus]